MNEYHFKRSFYYETEKAIREQSAVFVLGPRKCGKTVCLKQLASELNNAVYIDMKADFDNDTERREFVARVLRSVADDDSVVYLIDEATYMALPDKDIAKIAGVFAEYDNKKTKVVFAGSQSKALEFWGHIAFGGNAAFIRTGFLSYPEWLAYKGTAEVSEQTYLGFLFGVRDFYKDFAGTREYLQGCLDETVIANKESVEYVIGNPAEDLNVDMLLDVLYASLIKLYNRAASQRFVDAGLINAMLENYFGDVSDDERQRASDFLGGHYKDFMLLDGYDCRSAMRFLSNCGLITLTYVSDEMDVDPYISEKVLKSSRNFYTTTDLFERFKLTIDYPMFTIDLVNNILDDRTVDMLPDDLLGSIVESHVRSLLPHIRAFEYRCNGMEMDYISLQGKGIGFDVADTHAKNLCYDILHESYRKILLTKDSIKNIDGIQHIPYFQFIHDNCDRKDTL